MQIGRPHLSAPSAHAPPSGATLSPMPPHPSRLRRLVAGLAVSTLGLALLEGGARLLMARRPELAQVETLDPGGRLFAEMDFSPDLLWRLVPGEGLQGGVTVRVNPDRMRGPPLVRPLPMPGVVFLGDSSVFGWGVTEDQAFAWKALQRARDLGAPEALTVNAATPGYSSSQARLRLDALLPDLQPEVVVIATLWSDLMSGGWTDRELFTRFSGPERAAELARHDRLRHSALFGILQARLLSLRPVPADRMVLWSTIFTGEGRGGTARVPPADHRANLAHMDAAATAAGARVIHLILPTNRSTDRRPPESQLDDYRDNFHDTAARIGAPVLDCNRIWADLPDADTAPFFMDEVHPSAAGHAAIAEALAPLLVQALAAAPGG